MSSLTFVVWVQFWILGILNVWDLFLPFLIQRCVWCMVTKKMSNAGLVWEDEWCTSKTETVQPVTQVLSVASSHHRSGMGFGNRLDSGLFPWTSKLKRYSILLMWHDFLQTKLSFNDFKQNPIDTVSVGTNVLEFFLFRGGARGAFGSFTV